MAYTKEQIEWLHDMGYMPDWAYYQQNGKSAQHNWDEQHRKIAEKFRQKELERRKQAQNKSIEQKIHADLEKQLDQKLEKVLDRTLNDLLKGFK